MPETTLPEPVLLEEQTKAEPQKRRPGRPPGPLLKKQKPRKDIGHYRKHRNNSYDIMEAVRLRVQNKLPWETIGKMLGVPKSTIADRLGKLHDLLDISQAEAYELAKPTIMSSVEKHLLLDLIDDDRRQKASLNNTAYAFSQVHTARRLEMGKTTSNVGLVAAIRLANEDKEATVEAELIGNAT